MNRLLLYALDIEDVGNIKTMDKKVLRENIQVAGVADNTTYLTNGYRQACKAGIALYSASLIAVIAAGCLYIVISKLVVTNNF